MVGVDVLVAVGSSVAVAAGDGAGDSVAVGSGSATNAAALDGPASPHAPVSRSADETNAAPTISATKHSRTNHSLRRLQFRTVRVIAPIAPLSSFGSLP